MAEFYLPPNKKELIIWIKQRYFASQCVAGLERLSKKQLFAIFFKMRKEIDYKEFIS